MEHSSGIPSPVAGRSSPEGSPGGCGCQVKMFLLDEDVFALENLVDHLNQFARLQILQAVQVPIRLLWQQCLLPLFVGHTNLLRSNCPIPERSGMVSTLLYRDWRSGSLLQTVTIAYRMPK